jgi:hypothetical protein
VIESAEADWPRQESAVEPEIEQIAQARESTGWDAAPPAEIAVAQTAPELADTQEIPAEAIAFATYTQEETSAAESPAAEPVEAAAPIAALESAVSPAAAVTPATTDELVNAVVARVIAKLQPQIAEMINEEILRPVVSALVRREIDNQ